MVHIDGHHATAESDPRRTCEVRHMGQVSIDLLFILIHLLKA